MTEFDKGEELSVAKADLLKKITNYLAQNNVDYLSAKPGTSVVDLFIQQLSLRVPGDPDNETGNSLVTEIKSLLVSKLDFQPAQFDWMTNNTVLNIFKDWCRQTH